MLPELMYRCPHAFYNVALHLAQAYRHTKHPHGNFSGDLPTFYPPNHHKNKFILLVYLP